MVKVIPFKGVTYNYETIKNLDNLMSPPYDIISEKMQTELYNKHPKNFVRLILGKQNSDDNEENNRYTRAKELLNQWFKESILIESNKPSIFPYKIEYNIDSKKKIMNGFFILLKLDPEYKEVRAHEKTLSKPKEDRLNLMRACHSNLEPIQLLYIDDEDKIRKLIDESLYEPFINVKGYDNFNHKLWKIDNIELISKIQNELKDKILFIADGHHRYQTAINYSNELKDKNNENAPYNYRMVILANMFDYGLSILPTHRLIKKSDIDIKLFLNNIKEYFIIEEKKVKIFGNNFKKISEKIIKDLQTKKDHKFALYIKGSYYILTLKDESFMDDFAKDKSKVWRTLDVSILHKIILEHFMNINQNNIEDYIKYTRIDEEAVRFVEEGLYDFSFLMNATKINELKAVAEAGEHMPQKSTYFLPKMLSGLVFYKM
ncbi:MAG: hypothetical protein AYK22_00235 [Thermoplasmatales archaeon SG8-52-3]|nr:MAG: hypothetical protein AYK22_00235 [Thermoplasmatales archaeon SG8-52-3]